MKLLELLRNGEITIKDDKDPSKIYSLSLDLEVDANEKSFLHIQLSAPNVSQFNGDETARQVKLQQLYELINIELITIYRLKGDQDYSYDNKTEKLTINPTGLAALGKYCESNSEAKKIILPVLKLFNLKAASPDVACQALKELFQSHILHLVFVQPEQHVQRVMSMSRSMYYYILDPEFGGLDENHKLGNIIFLCVKAALNRKLTIDTQSLPTKNVKLSQYKHTYRGIAIKPNDHRNLEFTALEIPNPTLEINNEVTPELAVSSNISALVPSAASTTQGGSNKKNIIVDLFADDGTDPTSLSPPVPSSTSSTVVPKSPAPPPASVPAAAKVTPSKISALFSAFTSVLPDALQPKQSGVSPVVTDTSLSALPPLGPDKELKIKQSTDAIPPRESTTEVDSAANPAAPSKSNDPIVGTATKHIPSSLPPNREPPAVPVAVKKSPVKLTPEQVAEQEKLAAAEKMRIDTELKVYPVRKSIITSINSGTVSPLAGIDPSVLAASTTNTANADSSKDSSKKPAAVSKDDTKPADVSVTGPQSLKNLLKPVGQSVGVTLDPNDVGLSKLRNSIKGQKEKLETARKHAEELRKQTEAAELAKKNVVESTQGGDTSLSTSSTDRAVQSATGNSDLKPPPAVTPAPIVAEVKQTEKDGRSIATDAPTDETSVIKVIGSGTTGNNALTPPPAATLIPPESEPNKTGIDATTATSSVPFAAQPAHKPPAGNITGSEVSHKTIQRTVHPNDGLLPPDSDLMLNAGPIYTAAKPSANTVAPSSDPVSVPAAALTPAPAKEEKTKDLSNAGNSAQVTNTGTGGGSDGRKSATPPPLVVPTSTGSSTINSAAHKVSTDSHAPLVRQDSAKQPGDKREADSTKDAPTKRELANPTETNPLNQAGITAPTDGSAQTVQRLKPRVITSEDKEPDNKGPNPQPSDRVVRSAPNSSSSQPHGVGPAPQSPSPASPTAANLSGSGARKEEKDGLSTSTTDSPNRVASRASASQSARDLKTPPPNSTFKPVTSDPLGVSSAPPDSPVSTTIKIEAPGSHQSAPTLIRKNAPTSSGIFGGFFNNLLGTSSAPAAPISDPKDFRRSTDISSMQSPVPPKDEIPPENYEAMLLELQQVNNSARAIEYLSKHVFIRANKLSKIGKADEFPVDERIKRVQDVINQIVKCSSPGETDIRYGVLCELYEHINDYDQMQFLNVHKRAFFDSVAGKAQTEHWLQFIKAFKQTAFKVLINSSQRFEQIGMQIQYLEEHAFDTILRPDTEGSNSSQLTYKEMIKRKVAELRSKEASQKSQLRASAKK